MGQALLQSGLLDEGIGELERYLAGEPEAPDRKEVREVICEARDQLSKVH
ncbi:MAG TPA: hypothetical protein VGG06_04660 [Thermoanaerobaculia bacterium]|jgi:hypothetical protein